MEDGELVAVVLQEPGLRIDLELEAVGRGGHVATRHVVDGDAVLEDDDAARLVRSLGGCVLA